MLNRIIALDKASPRVGNIDEFRPIIISSYAIKFIESLMKEKVMERSVKELNPRQYGFVKHSSI